MNFTNEQITQIKTAVKETVSDENSPLMVSVAEVKTKIESHSESIKSLTDNLTKVSDKANHNSTKIEKVKTWILGLALTGLGTVLSYVIIYYIKAN